MKARLQILAIALLALAAVAGAQQSSTGRIPQINTYTGDPTGQACTVNQLVQSTTQGVCSCIGGVFQCGITTSGGTLTGPLNLASDPTASAQAATKNYVDAHTGGSIVITSPPYNASGFIAKTTVSSNTSAGAFTIPVASTSSFSVGHVVIIANGASSNQKDFAGFISAVNANSIVISNVAVTGNLLPPTALSGTTGIASNITQGWLVYEVGTTTLANTALVGATQITLTNASSYSVGQGIFIFGAGTGGVTQNSLVTTITAVNGNVLTLANPIGVQVSAGTAVQHDDTAAFQTAVNLASVTQSVSILVPDGYYQINGNLNATTLSPVQFPSLPYYPNSVTNWLPMTTIQIAGVRPAPEEQSYLVSGYAQPHMSGAIIKSGLNNSTSAIFNTPNTSGSFTGISNISVIFRNLTFRTYPNPQMAGIYMEKSASLQVIDCDFDTGDTGPTTQPTNQGYNVAIRTPTLANGANNIIQRSQLVGWYYGVWPGEHLRLEQVRLDNLFYPLYFTDASGYEVTGDQIYLDGDPHGIYVPSASSTTQQIRLEDVNIEHQTSPAWVVNVDDFNDSGNHLTGSMSIERANPSQAWNQVGGSGVQITDLQRLKQTKTFSAVASVALAAWYSPIYSTYELICNGLTTSAATDIHLNFSTNGGSSYDTTNSYIWGASWTSGGTGGNTGNATLAGFLPFQGASITLPANGSYSVRLSIDDPTTATLRHVDGNINLDSGTGAFEALAWHGSYQSASVVNALQLAPATGTISGTCTVKGVN